MATAPLTVAALLRRDLARYRGTRPPAAPQPSRVRLLPESLVFRAGFQAVVLYRVSPWLGAAAPLRRA